MPGENPISQQIETASDGHDVRLVRMQAEAFLAQAFARLPAQFRQSRLVVVEDHHVIHVAEIRLDPEVFLHEVVEGIEIEIGEELAGEVADGCRSFLTTTDQ